MSLTALQHLWDTCSFLVLPLVFALLYGGLFTFLWFKKALRFDRVQITIIGLVSTMIAVLVLLSYLGS